MVDVTGESSMTQRIELNASVTEALLHRTLELLIGPAQGPFRTKREFPDPRDFVSPLVILFSPSRRLMGILRERGYTELRSFVAIPSKASPRWLLPFGEPCGMLSGIQIYQPHKLTPRFMKSLLVRVMKLGWEGVWSSRVLIASKGRLPLESLVENVTGEAQPLLALSLGRQAAVRKLTVQVMRPNGDILGYIKLPFMDAAARRVRNEASILERLWKFPALRAHIPRILYAGDWNGTYMLFQSALRGGRGPVTFNEMHEDFLQTLSDVHSVEMPAETLIDALARMCESPLRRLGAQWETLGREVIQRSTYLLQGRALRYGVMHGDFAPWNTRTEQQKLLVFDWESAEWLAPTSWDIFHFSVQTATSFGKDIKECLISRPEPLKAASFMLYLLNSVCQFLEEDNFAAIHERQQLLVGQLHTVQ